MSRGNDAMLLVCPVFVTLPVAPPVTPLRDDPRFPEERDRLNEGVVAAVGKYWERASRTSARACMKFSKDCLMFWLSTLSCSSRAFSEDVAIPLSIAASVWELDEFDSEALAQRFARLSLLK